MVTDVMLAKPFVESQIGVIPVGDGSFSVFVRLAGGARETMFAIVQYRELEPGP